MNLITSSSIGSKLICFRQISATRSFNWQMLQQGKEGFKLTLVS